MAQEKQSTPSQETPFLEAVYGSEENARRLQSRRRFVKAGVVATPVLMSLTSRPVWGNTLCSLSGLMSGNVSRQPEDYECSGGYGCTPGFWKTKPDLWTSLGVDPGQCIEDPQKGTCTAWSTAYGTRFNSVFGGSYSEPMMWMLHQSSISGSLEFHLIAAYLNALSFPAAYGATVEELQDAYAVALGSAEFATNLKTVLVNMNERSCPIDAHGDCAEEFGFVYVEDLGQCVQVTK